MTLAEGRRFTDLSHPGALSIQFLELPNGFPASRLPHFTFLPVVRRSGLLAPALAPSPPSSIFSGAPALGRRGEGEGSQLVSGRERTGLGEGSSFTTSWAAFVVSWSPLAAHWWMRGAGPQELTLRTAIKNAS